MALRLMVTDHLCTQTKIGLFFFFHLLHCHHYSCIIHSAPQTSWYFPWWTAVNFSAASHCSVAEVRGQGDKRALSEIMAHSSICNNTLTSSCPVSFSSPPVPIFQSWRCNWFTDLLVLRKHLQQLQTVTYIHRFVLFTIFVWLWLDLLRSHRFVLSHCPLLLYRHNQFIILCSLWNDSGVTHYMSIVICVAAQKHWFSKKGCSNDGGCQMNHVFSGYSLHCLEFGLLPNSP